MADQVDTDTLTGIFSNIPELLKRIPGALNRIPAGVKAVGGALKETLPELMQIPGMAQGDPEAFAQMQKFAAQRQAGQQHQALEAFARQHKLLGENEPMPPGVDLATVYAIAHPKQTVTHYKPGESYSVDGGPLQTAPGTPPRHLLRSAEGSKVLFRDAATGDVVREGEAPNRTKAPASLAAAKAAWIANPTDENRKVYDGLKQLQDEEGERGVRLAASKERARKEVDKQFQPTKARLQNKALSGEKLTPVEELVAFGKTKDNSDVPMFKVVSLGMSLRMPDGRKLGVKDAKTVNEAISKGATLLDKDDEKRYQQYESIEDDLGRMAKLLPDVAPMMKSQDWPGWMGKALEQKLNEAELNALSKKNPSLAAYLALMKSMSLGLTKTKLPVGRIPVWDQQTLMNTFVSPQMTFETQVGRLAQLHDQVEDNRLGLLGMAPSTNE